MKRLMNILFHAGVILVLRAVTASGQERTGGGTWGFVNVRYDSESPASLYAGYGWRRAFAMGGAIHDPRTGYSELVGGVGAAFSTRTSEHWIAVATSVSNTGSRPQVFWLPRIRLGAMTSRAQVKWTIGHGESQAHKLSISPLSLTLPLGRRLSGGVATDLSAAAGARTRVSTGLELRLALSGAAVGVDALREVTGEGSRLRLFLASQFQR